MYRYKVKVRGLMFLWGSAGLTQNLTFPSALILHIRNDELGEPVAVGTRAIDGTSNTVGTLKAGEAMSIAIQNISGVFADCALDSNVCCAIDLVRQ
jgi:hypothetical protein